MNAANCWKYSYAALFFIIIAGTVFCDFGGFLDSRFKSKWYLLFMAVPLGSLLVIAKERIKIGKPGVSEYLLMLLLLYCMVRVVSGGELLPFVIFALLLFLLYSIFTKISSCDVSSIVSGAIAVTAFVLVLYSIVQYAGVLPNVNPFGVIGNFDNVAGYASMLSISTPFILCFTLHKDLRFRRIAWIVYVVVVAGVLFSGSRAGILAMLVVGFLYVLKYCKQRWVAVLRKKWVLAVLISAILSGLYFAKKDSADGRVLIWKCTWEMIKEKPLFGHGYKSFKSEYMVYQADYFQKKPDSEFVMLADNVKNPFNEFLLLIVEFGLVGFIITLLFAVSVVAAYRKKQTDNSFIMISALSAIAVFTCFSYPLKYPFTWLVLVFAISQLLPYANSYFSKKSVWFYKLFVALSSLILIGATAKDIYFDRRWYGEVNRLTFNKIESVAEYEQLYPHLKTDAYFLYNYAAKLNSFSDYNKSLDILIECEKSLNDYDIQMLLADNYSHLQRFEEAEKHYIAASRMCPNRFVALYRMMKMYDESQRPEKAVEMAEIIVNKKIKVPSSTISKIKSEAKNMIESYR